MAGKKYTNKNKVKGFNNVYQKVYFKGITNFKENQFYDSYFSDVSLQNETNVKQKIFLQLVNKDEGCTGQKTIDLVNPEPRHIKDERPSKALMSTESFFEQSSGPGKLLNKTHLRIIAPKFSPITLSDKVGTV